SSRCHLSQDAISALSQYHWPGNIRELENVIQRALVMRHGDYITAHDLMLPIELVASVPTAEPTSSFGHVEAKKQAEYQFILEKLRQFG
ncbi:sigma-54-dependent Fis family transcriptional regulator, partial [Vibrio parahaemolyticus]|nr:sigma-54-dependent Fis family transcriptional regulator [Vibrio parahaemolyticus]